MQRGSWGHAHGRILATLTVQQVAFVVSYFVQLQCAVEFEGRLINCIQRGKTEPFRRGVQRVVRGIQRNVDDVPRHLDRLLERRSTMALPGS